MLGNNSSDTYDFPSLSVLCSRTYELVDGPNASHITPTALDRWEARLEDGFRGHPFDMLDAALSDTVSKFPVDIQVRTHISFNFWLYILMVISLVPKHTLHSEEKCRCQDS